MELRARDGAVEPRAHQELPDVGVGLEQYGGGEQHVVNANDAVLVQLDVVGERRPPVQGEVQRVVQVVVEVRAGADHEIDETAVHQLDDAAAQPGGGQCAGQREADGRVVGRIQHPVREDVACFRQPPGVERLEPFVDQRADAGVTPAGGSSGSACRGDDGRQGNRKFLASGAARPAMVARKPSPLRLRFPPNQPSPGVCALLRRNPSPPVLELAGDRREVLSGSLRPAAAQPPAPARGHSSQSGRRPAERDQDERRARRAGDQAQAVRHPALPRGVYRREPARSAGTGEAGGECRGPVEGQSEERSAEAANERRHGFDGGGRRLTCRWRGTRRRPSVPPR